MANNSFKETEPGKGALPAPISVKTLQTVFVNKDKVRWKWDAKLTFGYDPFLIYVVKTDATKLFFDFINCDDGKRIAGVPFEMPLANISSFHSGAPSTTWTGLDTTSADDDDRTCVVMAMFNPKDMSAAMTQAASNASQAAIGGKWPGTALAESRLAEAQVLVRRLLTRLNQSMPSNPLELQAFRKEVAAFERDAASL